LCDVPTSKLVNKFDLKSYKSMPVTICMFVELHFYDENIKCIHTSPFGLVFWHCVAFLYEEGGRRVGQNWARARTAKINFGQAAMASMTSLK